jgi:hypothetical protein
MEKTNIYVVVHLVSLGTLLFGESLHLPYVYRTTTRRYHQNQNATKVEGYGSLDPGFRTAKNTIEVRAEA